MAIALILIWLGGAGLSHAEMRSNPTAAIGFWAQLLEILVALAWPIVAIAYCLISVVRNET